MSVQQFNAVCDNSTLANFKSWAKAISDWFATCGWSRTGDSGQVDWAALAAPPGTGAFVYEIWQPGDVGTLTPFYVKMEYGNFSAQANAPQIKVTIAESTDGSGGVTGLNFTQAVNQTNVANQGASLFDCRLHGANNRIAAMMWRNGTGGVGRFFAIERSLDGSGAPTGDYVTLWTVGTCSTNNSPAGQRSLLFGVGVAPATGPGIAAPAGWVARCGGHGGLTSAFYNKIPFDTCSPLVGRFGQPCTVCGVTVGADTTEAVTFDVTLYGATRTYLPSKTGTLGQVVSAAQMMCMRYD